MSSSTTLPLVILSSGYLLRLLFVAASPRPLPWPVRTFATLRPAKVRHDAALHSARETRNTSIWYAPRHVSFHVLPWATRCSTLCVRLAVQFQRIAGRRAGLSVHQVCGDDDGGSFPGRGLFTTPAPPASAGPRLQLRLLLLHPQQQGFHLRALQERHLQTLRGCSPMSLRQYALQHPHRYVLRASLGLFEHGLFCAFLSCPRALQNRKKPLADRFCWG